jgi:hypothetical protein
MNVTGTELMTETTTNMKDAPRDGTKIGVFDEHDQYHPMVWWTDERNGFTDGDFMIKGVHFWIPCQEPQS